MNQFSRFFQNGSKVLIYRGQHKGRWATIQALKGKMLDVKLDPDESIVTVRGGSVVEGKPPPTKRATKTPERFNTSSMPFLNGRMRQESNKDKLIQTICFSTSTL